MELDPPLNQPELAESCRKDAVPCCFPSFLKKVVHFSHLNRCYMGIPDQLNKDEYKEVLHLTFDLSGL